MTGAPGARRVVLKPLLVLAAVATAVASVALAVPTAAPASAAAAAPPDIRAPAAILVEPATGDVIFARRASERRAIASTTKLMTALLALERLRLGEEVAVVPYAASTAESTAGLRAGERLTAADLLRALLLASANEAAETLAVRVGGSERRFVTLMNRRARALGLTETHYTTPVGLDRPGNRSSARDLVRLTLILRRNAFFRRVTDLPRATLHSGAHPRTILNRNLLIRGWAPADGVKTGHTLEAGYVLVGSASQHGVTVLSAVLGDPSEAARDADSLALLRFGLRRYQRVAILRARERVGTVAVEGRTARAAVVSARTIRRTMRRGERVTRRVIGVPATLHGPLPARTRVGTVELRWRGRTIERVPLVTSAAVPAPSVLHDATSFLGRSLLLLGVLAAALGSLSLVLRARRRRRRRRRRAERQGEIA